MDIEDEFYHLCKTHRQTIIVIAVSLDHRLKIKANQVLDMNLDLLESHQKMGMKVNFFAPWKTSGEISKLS